MGIEWGGSGTRRGRRARRRGRGSGTSRRRRVDGGVPMKRAMRSHGVGAVGARARGTNGGEGIGSRTRRRLPQAGQRFGSTPRRRRRRRLRSTGVEAGFTDSIPKYRLDAASLTVL